MKSRKDMLTSRKDLKTIPTYLVMPVLHAACWGGHHLLASKLIKMGCPINLQDDIGCTPLHWCTCNGHKTLKRQVKYIAIAEQLVTAGADCTIMDASTRLPVELTQEPNPKFEAMRMAILKHAQKSLNNALLLYCQTGDVSMARRCLFAGAEISCGDWLNDTPLHIAITYGHKELIDMLVDRSLSFSLSFSLDRLAC
jgi:ankyrin repeat protein